MLIPFDAVLFDNDGVLVDSHVQVELAWRQVCAEFELDYAALESELIGVPAADTLARYLPPDRLADAVPRLEDLEVEHAGSTPPLTGALPLTGSLPNHAWAVVTSATRRLADARWAGAGINPPEATITADDIVNGKPDPEPFVKAAALLNVSPKNCVVFEDSPSGGIAAAGAGCTVIAVGDQPWTISPVARVPDLASVSFEYTAGTFTLRLSI